MLSSTPNFVDTFPSPNDAEMHRAGRQGILDQKEDDTCTDAQWLALQHRCWAQEIHDALLSVEFLEFCRVRGKDPATGARPRRVSGWPSIEQRTQEEQASLRLFVAGVLNHYADHFGASAAQLFEAFVTQCVPDSDVFDPQADLFA
jgi:hypothetical protein